MAKIAFYPKFRAVKDDGSAAAGWKLYTYAAGGAVPLATYADSTEGPNNTNPVILDGAGEASVWLKGNLAYKFVLTDDNDVPQRTVDGINADDAGSFTTLAASGASSLSDTSIDGDLVVAGQIASLASTGAAPLVVASTTKVSNLNVDKLDDGDWGSPGAIGGTAPAPGTFTTLQANSDATFKGKVTEQSAQGGTWVRGVNEEEITLNTAGTTTDSVGNLLPANSIIEAVCARVTAAVTVATDWKLGESTTPGRFCAAQSGAQLNLGSTVSGLLHRNPDAANAAAGPVQSAAAKLRITTTGTPGAGKIRVTVYYSQFIAATA